jgi:hypothetical protein
MKAVHFRPLDAEHPSRAAKDAKTHEKPAVAKPGAPVEASWDVSSSAPLGTKT